MNFKRSNQLNKNNGYFLMFLCVISVALLLASCAIPSHYRMYSGDSLPKDQVAFLVTDYEGFLAATARIHSVDGKQVSGSFWDETIKIELLPGYHTISVGYCDGEYYTRTTIVWYSKELITLDFYAEQGHTYLLRANASSTKRTWKPVITDVTPNRSN